MAQQDALQKRMPSAWPQYFPDDVYGEQDRRALLIGQLLDYYRTSEGWELLASIQTVTNGYTLEVDYERLCSGCKSADLVAALDVQPLEGLACIGAAAYEVCTLQSFHVYDTQTVTASHSTSQGATTRVRRWKACCRAYLLSAKVKYKLSLALMPRQG